MPSTEPSPSLSGARVLITGGFGFIGASLARALVGRGNQLVLLDNAPYAGSTAEALGLRQQAGVELLQRDILDPALAELGTGFDYIVHSAAILGITRVVEQPLLTVDVNIRGTHNVLQLATRQRALKRFLLFSTSEVYGPHALQVDEATPASIPQDGLRWGYAASKVACEFYGRAYAQEQGMPVVIVRPFNVYGPHRPGGNAMSTLVTRALKGEELQLSGDGQQIRTWCFIDDFVDGLLRCATDPAAIGEAFNLGDDREPLTLQALAERIVTLTGSRSRIRITGSKLPDVRFRAPDLSKARERLGFAPRTLLDTGLIEVARIESERLAALGTKNPKVHAA